MQLTNQVLAPKEQFMEFYNSYPKDTPVTMLNILKFKAKSGQGDETGADAYKRYSKNVAPLLAKVGGKVLWSGNVKNTVIGDSTDQPHLILVVEYPSTQAFMDMATSEEYKVVGKDRELALEYGGLLACR